MATGRPVVSIFSAEEGKKAGTASCPAVLSTPLRPDLVRYVHTNMNKNARQAYGNMYESGYDTAAASWGTGRAVARIPRVPGGGTHRCGQAAFGNMCRGGGMFAPTKTWRKWHRKVNVTQKRHAMASALAASALPALVMARGHRVDEVNELPMVVSDGAQKIVKTKDALALLERLGLKGELAKVNASKKLRCGTGKTRNRRYVQSKGPLVIYKDDEGISKAVRNLPGVDACSVERMNLLQLAPGGTFGRLVIWTESAFQHLKPLFGNFKAGSTLKKNYNLPRAAMTNADVARIINSDAVQSVVKAAKVAPKSTAARKNCLTNKSVLGRVMPGEVARKKNRSLAHKEGTAQRKTVLKAKAKTAAKAKQGHSVARKAYNGMEAEFKAFEAPKAAEAAEEEAEE